MDFNRLEHKMTRFRTRRKGKDQPQVESATDYSLPLGLSFTSKGFGKHKKLAPEQKPAVDLTTVLPASNDFRTSLLMPNLSARFSMLREQDDPATKIGKANDDSVLFPKRASRLNLFAHNTLADITEAGSIRESIRPPFASRERAHSYDVGGYDSDGDSSIMKRARPGEGNNLFGGRQKLYKIPGQLSSKSQADVDGSQQNAAATDGKPMYENDVSSSLFQKYRYKERENRTSQLGRESLEDTEDSSPRSPAASFKKYRETTSSTASAQRRDSTAATSVDSQPFSPQKPHPSHNHNNATTPPVLASPKSPATSRPGTDRSANTYWKSHGKDVSSLDSLHIGTKDALDISGRPPTAASDMKHSPDPPSTTNSSHRQSPPSKTPAPSSLRFHTASPSPSEPPSATLNHDTGVGDGTLSKTPRHKHHGFSRPMSPPISDGEDATAFADSLQPEDRGKATAMGLFDRPHRMYDEQKFSERQVQMHHGRGSPPPLKISTSQRSSPSLPELNTPLSEANVDVVAEQLKPATQPSVVAVLPAAHSNITREDTVPQEAAVEQVSEPIEAGQDNANIGTFLEDSARQSLCSQPEAVTSSPSNMDSRTASSSSRSTLQDFKFPAPENELSQAQTPSETRPNLSPIDMEGRLGHQDASFDVQSADVGLGGLIQKHLRADSDKSSVYPSLSPHVSLLGPKRNADARSSAASQLDGEISKPSEESDAQLQMARNAKQILATANMIKNNSKEPRQDQTVPSSESEGVEKFNDSLEGHPNWQDELQRKHHRDGSTETQQEQAAFSKELAERRRRVQEKLKSVAEASSRSGSPTPGAHSNATRPGSGFSAMIRSKTSRAKLNNPPVTSPTPFTTVEQSGKAMRVLGLGNASCSVPLPGVPSDDLWKEEEEKMLEAFARRPKPKQTTGSSTVRAFPRPKPAPLSSRGGRHDEADRAMQNSATPGSAHASPRDQSPFGFHGGRSEGYTGGHEQNLGKASVDGRGNIHTSPGASKPFTIGTFPAALPDQPEICASGMSRRDQSKADDSSSVLESKPPTPPSSAGNYSPNAGRVVPVAPPVTGSSPAKSSVSSIPLPTTNGRTTPAFRDRKRSVNKHMISEPKFVSTTYTVSTVDLPPNASLRNGEGPPAIPAMNPRRRDRMRVGTGTIHTMLPSFTGRTSEATAEMGGHPRSAGPSTSSAGFGSDTSLPYDGDTRDALPAPLKPKPRLRKISSEGGELNNKLRYQSLKARPSPVLPTFPVVKRGPEPAVQPVEGDMI